MKEGERGKLGKKESGVNWERKRAGLTGKARDRVDYERRRAGLTGKERGWGRL